METFAKTRKISDERRSARRHFEIAQREPWQVPSEDVVIPAPEEAPSPPPSPNLIATLLPPTIMVGGYLVMARFMSSSTNMAIFMIPMIVMGLGIPLGNLGSVFFEKRAYKKKIAAREQNYRKKLAQERERIALLIKEQQRVLNREYPPLSQALKIALAQGRKRRLWWRRKKDGDFLSLRIGAGFGKPTFQIKISQDLSPKDDLMPLAREFLQAYEQIPNLPVLLDLPRAGSVAIDGDGSSKTYSVARRLLVDVIVHHAPQDVLVAVIADTEDGKKRWEWLKWTPHTRAVQQNDKLQYVAFSPGSIDQLLEWLSFEYHSRLQKEEEEIRYSTPLTDIVLLLDDSGEIRQYPLIRRLAEHGHEVGIYLLIVGGRNWPRECRTRIKINPDGFRYTELWAGEESGQRAQGEIEPASYLDCERIARALAGLETTAATTDAALPDNVRLFDILDTNIPTLDTLKHNWSREIDKDAQLQFTFGLRGGRKGVQPVVLDLLPEDKGGIGAYHTILVGTTGSGKSEFMKSLVLSAAYTYSPKLLNFFFLDFKGGAAFNVLKDLPHVVGVVTNLSPELVERGLSAIEAEIERRQRLFAEAGVQNIWEYNRFNPDAPLSQMMLLLDEFARGMDEFPRLPTILDKVVRIGRSLGMYLLLANQNVSSAVERLLNNVGWRIALKVARKEEMAIIDRHLPIAKRAGQGYLYSEGNETIKFQAAYAGLPVQNNDQERDETFKIYQIIEDGTRHIFYETRKQEHKVLSTSEQNYLIELMVKAASEFPSAHPIYLDPLPEEIPLEDVFDSSAVQRVFRNETWVEETTRQRRLIAPIGYLDIPEECVQDVLEVDFKDKDGHLWIIGSPGSGKGMVLTTTLLALAQTHTPEEVHFYLLDFGAGALRAFDTLPHTGAVIRPSEKERIERLLNYLDAEMSRRSALAHKASKNAKRYPAIFLVIDNFAEVSRIYPDYVDRLSHYVRDGNAVDIHMIITTNRGADLRRTMASNIARRIVLQLADNDEYMDVLGQRVPPIGERAKGRGYWRNSNVATCQVAQPRIRLQNAETTEGWQQALQAMSDTWQGAQARPIGEMKSCVSLSDLLTYIEQPPKNQNRLSIPVGISYDDLGIVTTDILSEIPQWLVVGPPRSGKSNFLANIIQSVLYLQPKAWQIYYFSFRRSPLDWVKQKQPIQIVYATEAAPTLVKLKEMFSTKKTSRRKRQMIVLDDLGGAFEPGKEGLSKSLNELALLLTSQSDVYLIATGTLDELRLQLASPLVRSLKQGRTGVALSKDSANLDWLGAQMPLRYRKLDFPPGRGFWVSRGKATLLQVPLAGECDVY